MSSRKLSTAAQKLQFYSSELFQAYDATLEAITNALDLRDQESKGHSMRVTEMTVEMAKVLNVDEKELKHIRRGALLHDIGNLYVPESILYKQGELTVEEWVKIHMHPFHAFEMLGPIGYLKSVVNIPYCHHEKWNGDGYPRSLKGEEIPQAARIFAVIDVYDALTSDRPYRKAWSNNKALEHIRSERGKHFDPQVVDAFLEMEKRRKEE